MATSITHINLTVPSAWAKRKDRLDASWAFVIHKGLEILEKEKKTCKKNKV
jgi:hypothetical protein